MAIREYLTEYIDAIFPSAFRDRPTLHRLRDEITRHHRYLTLVTASGEDSDNERVMMCLQLLSVQTMLCFLLSVFYDIQVLIAGETFSCMSLDNISVVLSPPPVNKSCSIAVLLNRCIATMILLNLTHLGD